MQTIALEEHFWTAELAARPGTGPLDPPATAARLDCATARRRRGPDRRDGRGGDRRAGLVARPAGGAGPAPAWPAASMAARQARTTRWPGRWARRPGSHWQGFATLPTSSARRRRRRELEALPPASLGLVGGMVHSTLGTNGAFLDDARFRAAAGGVRGPGRAALPAPCTRRPRTVADVLFSGPRRPASPPGWRPTRGAGTRRRGCTRCASMACGTFERHPGAQADRRALRRDAAVHARPHRRGAAASRSPACRTRRARYARRNVWVTTSGMFSLPPVLCGIAGDGGGPRPVQRRLPVRREHRRAGTSSTSSASAARTRRGSPAATPPASFASPEPLRENDVHNSGANSAASND